MPTHLEYTAVRERQDELARRAERVRREREGQAPAPAWRERIADRLFVRQRPSRPADAPAGTC